RGGAGSGIYVGLDGGRFFLWVTSRTPAGVYTSTTVNDGKPHHLVYTYDGATTRLYVDGTLAASAAQSDGQPSLAQPAYLGFDQPNGEHWNGTLDELAFYPSALPDSRIAAHYQAGRG